MEEKLVYCVWRSSKGSKDLFAIFENADDAYHNARKWNEEAPNNYNIKVNFRVAAFPMYLTD